MKAGKSILKIQMLTTCLLLLCANAAQSVTIVTLEGNTVVFSYDADLLDPAFGELFVVGDSIGATPTGFLAESSNGTDGGINTFSAFGTVTVELKSGYQFKTVAVQQQGDYKLNGAATATVTDTLTVSDSNNASTNETTSMINDGLGLNDNDLHAWSSFGQFDLSTPTWDSVTSIELSLASILTASTTGSGDFAFIQSKHVAGGLLTTIETVVVPVPASIWLFISGFLGLLGVARRKH